MKFIIIPFLFISLSAWAEFLDSSPELQKANIELNWIKNDTGTMAISFHVRDDIDARQSLEFERVDLNPSDKEPGGDEINLAENGLTKKEGIEPDSLFLQNVSKEHHETLKKSSVARIKYFGLAWDSLEQFDEEGYSYYRIKFFVLHRFGPRSEAYSYMGSLAIFESNNDVVVEILQYDIEDFVPDIAHQLTVSFSGEEVSKYYKWTPEEMAKEVLSPVLMQATNQDFFKQYLKESIDSKLEHPLP